MDITDRPLSPTDSSPIQTPTPLRTMVLCLRYFLRVGTLRALHSECNLDSLLLLQVSFVPYRRGQRKLQLLIRLLLSRQSREQKQERFMLTNFAER